MAQMINSVQVRIDGRRQGLPAEPSWPRIFQVPHYLRQLNEEAYEPKIISIGPYHRQKDHLKAMETHKVRFLNDLFQRRNETSAQRYVEAMTGMMERARNCYSESLSISHEEFLEMMVLDGCFIAELIHKRSEGSYRQDPILNVSQIRGNILRDLRLVENQLPFFVLWELFRKMVEDPSPYIVIILKISKRKMPGLRVCEAYNENSMKNLKHLVDLFRINWLPSEDILQEYNKKKKNDGLSFIRSATELREAGIEFRSRKGGSLFDIKFEKGTFHIPTVRVEDQTEGIFRNVIACEQFNSDDGSTKYLTAYITVMDCLINSEKDVELLCQNEIIENNLGSDKAVAELFNRVGTEVGLSKSDFFYTKLFNDVNGHYQRDCNKIMANLRHNYFNTPWALISFLAAAFLLLLSLLQTAFTIFPRS